MYGKKKNKKVYGKGFVRRAGAVFVALALCIGLIPGMAWTEENEALATHSSSDNQINFAESAAKGSETKTATLSIVFGRSWDGKPDVALHKRYAFNEGDTVKDLLDQAVEAGDIAAYTLSVDGFPSSITRSNSSSSIVSLTNAANFSTYWSTYADGQYVDSAFGTVETALLQNGHSYQFAWESYPTAVAPDWSTLGEPEGLASSVEKTATLSIVFGIGWDGEPDVALHKRYTFNEGDTVKDLLDQAVEAGDIAAYTLSVDGFPSSISFILTLTNAANFSTYWSTYADGQYVDSAFGTVETALLQNGHSYQFAWESYPTAVAPDWSSLGEPSGVKPEPGQTTEPEIPNPSQVDPAEYSEELFRTLFTNIAASYRGTGGEWEALDMAAIGQASSVDHETITTHALEAMSTPGTTNLQKSALALTALGFDASKLKRGEQEYNLINAMAKSDLAYAWLNGKLSLLLTYASGNYDVPEDAHMTVDKLIEEVSAYVAGSDATDADMTAFAITALAPYRNSHEEVAPAIQAGLVKLRSMQLSNGGFASYDRPGVSNANSTAFVIIALAAVGIDCQTWVYAGQSEPQTASLQGFTSTAGQVTVASGTAETAAASPLNVLLSEVNEARTDFLFGGVSNALATEQGFRALVAYQGFKNTGAAYNIYTQASLGIAGLSASSNGVQGGSSSADNSAPLAATGDKNPAATSSLAVLAVLSLVSVFVLHRRMRSEIRAESTDLQRKE